MQRVEIVQDFALPPARVFAFLAEHENLGPLFAAHVTRVRDGEHDRDGVGSVRRLRLGLLPSFEETVTQVVPDHLIAYRITRGSPLTGHSGRMTFTPGPFGGTRLHYVITFSSDVPGLASLVRLGLDRSIRAGLRTVDEKA